MEDAPLETRHRMFFQHNGAPPHFGCQVMAYMSQCYGNWNGTVGPIPWPPRSLDQTPLAFLLRRLMKEMVYKTKVQMRGELFHQIMNAAAYIQEHLGRMKWAVNPCLN
jgi:hypothetical protein